MFGGDCGGGGGIYAYGEIPLDVDGDLGAAAGKVVDCAGVGEFFVDGGGCGGLEVFAETGAGVGVGPGWGFYLELV